MDTPEDNIKMTEKTNGPLYGLLSIIAVSLLMIVGLATDAIRMNMIIDLVKGFGVPGIVFVLWYFSTRSNNQTLQQYRQDMQRIERMYRNNVHLVEDYSLLAGDLKDIIIMNTQAVTRACDNMGRKRKTDMEGSGG
jgi:UPF0716 family protein affecting phage T7 exclusion